VPDTRVQELAQLPTRQTRVIIDTCYSGEILKDIPDESQRYILKTNGGVPERAGISMAAWSGEAYAAKGIFATDDGAAPAATGADKARRPRTTGPRAAPARAATPSSPPPATASSRGGPRAPVRVNSTAR
jgi:hypothetical protein